jgi:hypothetical protein
MFLTFHPLLMVMSSLNSPLLIIQMAILVRWHPFLVQGQDDKHQEWFQYRDVNWNIIKNGIPIPRFKQFKELFRNIISLIIYWLDECTCIFLWITKANIESSINWWFYKDLQLPSHLLQVHQTYQILLVNGHFSKLITISICNTPLLDKHHKILLCVLLCEPCNCLSCNFLKKSCIIQVQCIQQ